MSHLAPLSEDAVPEMHEDFAIFRRNIGFVPNAMLILQRKPALLKALAGLNRAVMSRDSEVPIELKRLVGLVATEASGCGYGMAHHAEAALLLQVDEARIADISQFESSPVYTDAERAALSLARAAARQPGEAGADHFARARSFWSEGQLVEILMVVAMCAAFDRWNDALATQLEPPSLVAARRVLGGTSWQPGKYSQQTGDAA